MGVTTYYGMKYIAVPIGHQALVTMDNSHTHTHRIIGGPIEDGIAFFVAIVTVVMGVAMLTIFISLGYVCIRERYNDWHRDQMGQIDLEKGIQERRNL